MNKCDFDQLVLDSMRYANKVKTHVPEYEQIMLYLNSLCLTTGQLEKIYSNAFLEETRQLLVNALILYEDGFYDCAFYSVRQAEEVINSMLYLTLKGEEEFNKWADKERFPMNSEMKRRLENLSNDYQEIKSVLTDFFAHHTELITQSHKIIHKQGFDTFYLIRKSSSFECDSSVEEEMKLFVDFLKYTVGKILIIYILLDPIALAISDEDINDRLNFDFMTESVDIAYFEEYLKSPDIIPKIKSTNFYKSFISIFSDYEKMLPSVYSVIRENVWDLDALNEIEKQVHLLNNYERFMFEILHAGIIASCFYYQEGFVMYFTTRKSNRISDSYSTVEFSKYLIPTKKFNQEYKKMFISVIMMYDQTLHIEHNVSLTEEQIIALKIIEKKGKEEIDKLER